MMRIYAPVTVPPPVEKFLAISIDDTSDTFFPAGITRVTSHSSSFPLPLFYIPIIFAVTL